MAKKKQDQSLAPRTTPADPESTGGLLLLPQKTAGVYVNEDTALTQSTVWACIRVISESLAGMPWTVGRLTNDGSIDKLEQHPLNWLLNFAPNPETQSFAFRETLWAWALGWGNGYAEIERYPNGEPANLWQLHPSRVRVIRNQGGALLYEIQNEGEQPTYLLPRDVFHLKGPSPDAIVGWSVIRMHARTIGLAIAQEDNAASFNENDSTPGGILSHPGKLSEQAKENILKGWEGRHRGPRNRRKIAVLEEAMKWDQVGLSPEDSQLLEQMQLTPAMICRIFRVPPHKVADLTRSTNNNIEHQDIEFVKDTLRPWAERGEAEADMKLFGRNNQARLVTVIDMAERERGDTAAQTQHVKEMLFCGVYSINEARRYLGMQGIGSQGDVRFVQSAMVPIDQTGQQQQPGPPTDNPPDQPTDTPPKDSPSDSPPVDESMLAAIIDKTLGVLTDACRRIIKRQAGQREQQGELSPAWMAKHREYCRESLMPAAGVLGACLGAKPGAAEVAVALFIDKHLDEADPQAAAVRLRELILAAASAKEVA